VVEIQPTRRVREVMGLLDYRWPIADILAQRCDASGSTVGGNFQISDDDGSMAQSDPSVAMDSAGDFVVAWKDERNGYDADMYAQRHDAAGVSVEARRGKDPVGREGHTLVTIQ